MSSNRKTLSGGALIVMIILFVALMLVVNVLFRGARVDLTENNLGNVDAGDEVAIVLDVWPGEVFKGRVRSVGSGVSSGKQTSPGALPTIENSRDWLRQAQRFPVAVEFDPAEGKRLPDIRIGGQAEVLVYTGEHPLMNFLGAGYIRLMSLLSYLY